MFSAGGAAGRSPFSMVVKDWIAKISDQRALRWAGEHWSFLAMKFQLGPWHWSSRRRVVLLARVPKSPSSHGVPRVVESGVLRMPKWELRVWIWLWLLLKGEHEVAWGEEVEPALKSNRWLSSEEEGMCGTWRGLGGGEGGSLSLVEAPS